MSNENSKKDSVTDAPAGRLKRVVIWLLCNIIVWVPAYYWLIYSNVYAENYSVFIIWLHFVVSLSVFDKDARAKRQKLGPSVNVIFNLIVDCIYGLVLATFGHYVLAAAYILGSKFQQETYTWDA